MATNYIQPGDTIDVVAGGAIVSGQLVLVGTLVGVAGNSAASGETYPLHLTGVWEVPKDTNLVITQGDRLFWDATNEWLDKTTTSQVCAGVAVTSELLAATTVRVRLGANTPSGT